MHVACLVAWRLPVLFGIPYPTLATGDAQSIFLIFHVSGPLGCPAAESWRYPALGENDSQKKKNGCWQLRATKGSIQSARL